MPMDKTMAQVMREHPGAYNFHVNSDGRLAYDVPKMVRTPGGSYLDSERHVVGETAKDSKES